MKKKEVLFFGMILITCIGILLVRYYINQNNNPDQGKVRILVHGQEFGIYPLNKDQVIQIFDSNTCEIKEGKCTMVRASCPALDYDSCIYQQPISVQNAGLIVCLPNDVVIEYIE